MLKLKSFRNEFTYPMDFNYSKLLKKHKEHTSIGIVPINPHPYRYIHNVEQKCSQDRYGNAFLQNTTLLVLGKSSVKNCKRRDLIRGTWGHNGTWISIKSRQVSRVSLVFLLGFDRARQMYVDAEANINNDVIQEDFVDAYWNNTKKLVMGFNWALKFCKDAKFIMWADDDFFVSRQNVLNLLEGVVDAKLPNFITGYLVSGSLPYRDPASKWYVSGTDYPFDRWPPYLAGGAYVLSMEVAYKFQIAFPYVKELHIDDSYLGIVAKQIGMTLIRNARFCTSRCFAYIRDRSAIAVHGYGDDELLALWERQTHVN
jgi:hypothetical protein